MTILVCGPLLFPPILTEWRNYMKTNKSYSKRLRVTKKGKIIARAPGQNHFNAKESGKGRMRRRRAVSFHGILSNTDKSRFLTGN